VSSAAGRHESRRTGHALLCWLKSENVVEEVYHVMFMQGARPSWGAPTRTAVPSGVPVGVPPARHRLHEAGLTIPGRYHRRNWLLPAMNDPGKASSTSMRFLKMMKNPNLDSVAHVLGDHPVHRTGQLLKTCFLPGTAARYIPKEPNSGCKALRGIEFMVSNRHKFGGSARPPAKPRISFKFQCIFNKV
jgi:hypothetical protein